MMPPTERLQKKVCNIGASAVTEAAFFNVPVEVGKFLQAVERKPVHSVVIFLQTTTGRTKDGAEIVFDGDIIIKLVKEDRFEDNYAYFDKNRYTKRPLENLRYTIAGTRFYDPETGLEQPKETAAGSGLIAVEIL